MFDKLRDYALEVLSFSWPIVVVSIITAISLRIVYLYINKRKLVLYEELFKLFFIIYVLCLFQVVTYRDISLAGVNYIPFKEIFRYSLGSSLFYRNVFGNMILFLPFGLSLGLFFKTDKFRYVIILSLITSISIELTQLVIGRVFDIDDVILNVLGAIIGFVIYRFFYQLQDKVPDFLKTEIALNIISILLVGGLIWFLVP